MLSIGENEDNLCGKFSRAFKYVRLSITLEAINLPWSSAI